MSGYVAPVPSILSALDAVGLADLLALDAFAAVDRSEVAALLGEFGRMATTVIAPTDVIGDREGLSFDAATNSVTTPSVFGPAYRQWVDGGWGALSAPAELGGGGLPRVVGLAVQEMLASANLSLSLSPVLTQGSVEALSIWGTPEQQARYLPPLLTGEWNGTMHLTEPDAGSDVGAVRTTATIRDDGRYELRGTKIFITWGEHDLTENIVHLVLARTPGSPAGTKGLSLFVVPKFLVDDQGAIGERNAVHCVGIEHKVGIHASPTCVIELDGAIGELVGDEGSGMRAMFTMMNQARLSIGLQGLAVAEASTQASAAYAATRVQGRSAADPGAGPVAIGVHPDVRRMLLLMASSTEAMRLLLYTTAVQHDLAAAHPDAEVRAAAQAREDLLTPVAKGWPTDVGIEVASLGIQVHGGMGYVEETGIARHWRDARIAPIYEGTNGIQAIDLVNRKLGRDKGRALAELLDEVKATASALSEIAELADIGETLFEAVMATEQSGRWLVGQVTKGDPAAVEDALSGATPFLEQLGTLLGGWLLARRAEAPGADERFVGLARFFAVERLSLVPSQTRRITAGASRLAIPA